MNGFSSHPIENMALFKFADLAKLALAYRLSVLPGSYIAGSKVPDCASFMPLDAGVWGMLLRDWHVLDVVLK